MDVLGIVIGIAVAVVIGVVYLIATHHVPAAAVPAAKDIAATVVAANADTWDAIKRDLPTIFSDEVAQLQQDKAALLKRAESAETALAAEIDASKVRLANVAAQVGSVISGISSQPASTLSAPAVAAAQAEDLAAVQAAAANLKAS